MNKISGNLSLFMKSTGEAVSPGERNSVFWFHEMCCGSVGDASRSVTPGATWRHLPVGTQNCMVLARFIGNQFKCWCLHISIILLSQHWLLNDTVKHKTYFLLTDLKYLLNLGSYVRHRLSSNVRGLQIQTHQGCCFEIWTVTSILFKPHNHNNQWERPPRAAK